MTDVEENMPSTSKASCGIFDMDIDDEKLKTVQSSASITEKSEDIDIIRPTEDRSCIENISDISVQEPSSCIQYLSVPVLGSSNLDITKTSTHSTVVQHSAAKTVKRKLKTCFTTKSEQALYKKLRLLQIKLSRCNNQKKKLATSFKIARNIMTNQSFLNTMENMTTAGRTLTLLQFREQKKKGKGRRFTLKEKIMALSIYKQSPKSYRLLRKMLLLPATQTLDKMVQKAMISPQYDERVFKQLKEKCIKMKESDKLSVLLFDEVSLQAYINYNVSEDRIDGLVDDKYPTKFVNHALVFMLRGLIKNFKQPIAYMFCNSATDAVTLQKYIVDVIKKVEEAGFRVVATVCDQGSNNQKAIKSLVEENRIKKLRNGEELRQNTFVVNESEIIPLYDPPHLLKGIRNNLLNKKLIYTNELGKECTAKWEHLEMLYAENPAYKGLRLVPKLTDQHVIKEKIGKMRVKFASQIFSQTVGLVMGYLAEKGILSTECRDTADLLIMFDNLFDSMNEVIVKKKSMGSHI
ncbi:hypothetical protein evm_014276 [Chilo suppressalis]|nr:hypothetical protein evm_014276 [Chilo suppressalis]